MKGEFIPGSLDISKISRDNNNNTTTLTTTIEDSKKHSMVNNSLIQKGEIIEHENPFRVQRKTERLLYNYELNKK